MAANIGVWFRWWHGCVDDPKLSVVAFASKQPRGMVIAVWACILERAVAAEEKGNPTTLPADEIGATVGLDASSVSVIIEEMQVKGLLDGSSVVNWEKRQPIREDDGAADRKRKQRHAMSHNVTHGHAVSHNVTQRHAPETETETETDLETELKEEEEEENGDKAQAPSPRPAKKTAARKNVDDEEWLRSLESSDAYRGIDVRSLLSKMIIWCENRRQTPTRQRLLNWLNREQKPMSPGSPSAREAAFDKLVEDANARCAKPVS